MAASNDNRLQYLLDQCLSGKETTAEREELDSILSDENTMVHLNRTMVDLFSQQKDLIDMPVTKQDQILEAIYSVNTTVRKLNKYKYIKWASVAALFFGILLSALWLGKEKIVFNQVGKYDSAKSEDKDLNKKDSEIYSSNSNSTILKLSNGSQIELESLDTGKVFEKSGINLKRTADGSLIIHFNPSLEKNQYASLFNTIITPRGQTYKVILSDGTIVHLNSDSRLSFPSKFGLKERRVSFEGEGYFDVAKDKTRQFIVSTNTGTQKQEIRVYGTQFNITAFKDDEKISTTLVEGSVRIKSLISGEELQMKPNELVVLDKAGLIKQPAELESTLAWMNNNFNFTNLPLEDVLKQVSRWYDVDVTYRDSIPKQNVWGQISRKKNLKEVLEILEKSNHIKFQQKGKEVIVMH